MTTINRFCWPERPSSDRCRCHFHSFYFFHWDTVFCNFSLAYLLPKSFFFLLFFSFFFFCLFSFNPKLMDQINIFSSLCGIENSMPHSFTYKITTWDLSSVANFNNVTEWTRTAQSQRFIVNHHLCSIAQSFAQWNDIICCRTADMTREWFDC